MQISKFLGNFTDLVGCLEDRTGAKHTEDLKQMKARCSDEH